MRTQAAHAHAPVVTHARARVTHTRIYPGTADQIRVVRADLRATLDGCPLADDAIQAASELAANAALHSASSLPGGYFTVRAEIHHDDYLWIEVEDDGGPWSKPISSSDGRHGLDIISKLATDWGIDGDHSGRVVWLRIDWARPNGGDASSLVASALGVD